MNRFIIEDTPSKIASSLCDQHIVKMPLEEAQMLCTAVWHHAPQYAEEKICISLYIKSILVHCGQNVTGQTIHLLGNCMMLC